MCRFCLAHISTNMGTSPWCITTSMLTIKIRLETCWRDYISGLGTPWFSPRGSLWAWINGKKMDGWLAVHLILSNQDSGTEPGLRLAYKISLNTFSDQACCSSFLLLRVHRAAVGVCVVWLLPTVNVTQRIFASFMLFFFQYSTQINFLQLTK